MDILQILFTDSFWAATLRIATPLIFGVLGALICERSGVLNLGIEGIFVAGAMAGWMAVWLGLGLWGGLVVAAFVGSLFGLLHAVLTVPLGLSQHVSGNAWRSKSPLPQSVREDCDPFCCINVANNLGEGDRGRGTTLFDGDDDSSFRVTDSSNDRDRSP